MRSDAITCGWFTLLVAIFLIVLLANHTYAAESQSATGNAFSKIKPTSQQARQFFNIREKFGKTNVGVANSAKRFGKLSLILSTELTSIGPQSFTFQESAHTPNRQRSVVTNNDALNALNAQIATLEAKIKSQQLQLGIDTVGNPPQERDTQRVESSISASDPSSQPPVTKKNNGWLIFGLVMVILVVALGVTWMRKQKKSAQFDAYESDQIVIKINDEPGNTQGSVVTPPEDAEDRHLIKHPSDGGAKEKSQSILPPEYEMLEEADIYLRFGHDKLAEEALREAIKINPQNPQAYLTLLRIYFSNEDADGFLELAKQLKLLGDESTWPKVAEMGRNLDESNSLYQ